MDETLKELKIKLATALYHSRQSPEMRTVLELLRAELETAKEMLVGISPYANHPPGALLHWQGQATALQKLIELIENGPEEMHAEAEQTQTEQE